MKHVNDVNTFNGLQIRCENCKTLLMKGVAVVAEVKCYRCNHLNTVKVYSQKQLDKNPGLVKLVLKRL